MTDPRWRLGERFELTGQVGTGTSGTVWRGNELADGTEHAIKLLRPELTSDQQAVAELYAGLGAVARLAHPGTVAVDDAAAGEGWFALRSRLVPGQSLRALITRRGAMLPAAATAIVAQLCDTLAATHAAGIAHGDLHPANVLLTSAPGGGGIPTVVVTDFAMSALLNRAAAAGASPAAPPAEYRAPELVTRPGAGPVQSNTGPADVYAIGVVLYECLAGKPPFTAQWPEAVAELHRQQHPEPIPGLSDSLWRIVAACLDKDARYRPTAAQLAAALRMEGAAAVPAVSASVADAAPTTLVPPVPAAPTVSGTPNVNGVSGAVRPAAAFVPAAQPAAAASGIEQTQLLQPTTVGGMSFTEYDEPAYRSAVYNGRGAEVARTVADRMPRVIQEHKTEAGIAAAVVVVGLVIGIAMSMGGGKGTAAAAASVPTPSASTAVTPSAAADASSAPGVVLLPSASASASPSAGPSQSGLAAAPGESTLVQGQTGFCLDTSGADFNNGTTEDIYHCNGTDAQNWTLTAAGQLTQQGGAYCLDDAHLAKEPGTKVVLWSCNGGANQQWTFAQNGSIVSVNANLCLDVDGKSTTENTDMVLWPCDGSQSQQWIRH